MTYVTQRRRQQLDSLQFRTEGVNYTPDFEETFDSAVGNFIEQNLSISSQLTKQAAGYDRQKQVLELEKQGLITRDEITGFRRESGFDWDGLSTYLKETKDVDTILSNEELNAKRKEDLLFRNDYANMVASQGSGVATFMGSMVAAALDPINVATMGMGGAGLIYKQASVLSKIGQGALRGAAINAGSELLIQPLVMGHKKDIGAPYTAEEAFTAIAAAAVMGATIDGTITGISSYLAKARGQLKAATAPPEKRKMLFSMEKAEARAFIERYKDDPEKVRLGEEKLRVLDEAEARANDEQIILSPEEEKLMSTMESVEEELKDVEYIQPVEREQLKQQLIDEAREELLPIAGNKMEKGDVKALEKEKRAIQSQIDYIGGGKKSGKAPTITQAQKAEMSERIAQIDARLAANKLAQDAEAELSRLDQGILNDELTRTLKQVEMEQNIARERVVLEENQKLRDEVNQVSVGTKLDFNEPPPKPKIRVMDANTPDGKATKLDLDPAEIAASQKAKADFDAIENPRVWDESLGDMVDANDIIKKQEKDIDSLSKLEDCINGRS